MLDGLVLFGRSLASFADPLTLLIIAGACLLGIVIGALPGLTATMGVALLTTLTLKMPSNTALLVLVCSYVGAIYGGSRSAILLNIPGTPANAAACLDGHVLAQQGLAGRAIGISTTGSVMGTLIGMFFLAVATPWLGEVALKFGAYEFFWLALFGVIISGNLTGDDPLKGWIAGFVGLFIATIGQDPIHAYERFAFDNRDLAGGFQLIPALVGAFGFAEVLTVLAAKTSKPVIHKFDTPLPRLRDVLKYWRTIIRSGVIGTFIGVVPGVGEDVASWSSYAAARRASKEPEKFGKGSVEGLMAAETGDNACVPGAIIPVLALAVPGSAPAAVLMAAMIIHGVQPGPLIMVNNPQFVFDVVAMMLFATIGIFFFGIALVKPLLKVLQVPRSIIMPIVFVLCVIGSYAISQRLFDVWTMLGFGVLGYVLRRYNYPMAPFVLGIVLGDLLDKNLRRGLVLSDGDLTPFFTRPISATLAAICIATILMNFAAVRRAAHSAYVALTPWRRAAER
jgi:putative tricarboxylic transport membrane protein